ncbi:unnamed protein product [Spirodela intermedia]|uniref:Uncharacterized protein n=1 Tax=Spirodela intermedia TaxID=51605 RepID=A0A7I8JU98_SPIIN|nr:unnamed protein product [Spirodela intermedia]CAA6673311.1 unnamed protein product [Spirodela intermedia]
MQNALQSPSNHPSAFSPQPSPSSPNILSVQPPPQLPLPLPPPPSSALRLPHGESPPLCTRRRSRALRAPCCGGGDQEHADRQGPGAIILFEQFGFSAGGGRVAVSVKGVSWRSPDPTADPYRWMGFVLIRQTSYERLENESRYSSGGFCSLLAADSTGNGSVAIEEPDEYSLLFVNCRQGLEVSMEVLTEMYNVGADGERDYLPAGHKPLPRLYFVFSVVYAAFLVAWAAVCFRQRSTVETIHVIMGMLLAFKALKLVCAAEDVSFVGRTGTPTVGTSSSTSSASLRGEKKVLMVVIPLQVIENVASVVIAETGPSERDWLTWNQIFLLVDVICCFAASKTDGKAARNLAKLTLFRQFYVVVVGYLYFTRIAVAALGAVLGYRHRWVSAAMAEGASLAFYLFVFYNFQPVERNPYWYVHDDEEAAAAFELEDDENFEL